MKKLTLAGLAISACLATPAAALEHEVVIAHDAGTIAADYKGAVTIETKQIGTAGAAGRPSTLRCRWTASLTLDRTASVGETMRSRRSMTQDDVASGSRAGWCDRQMPAIEKLVDSRRETFRTAMLALVEQDRATILAEAETARSGTRGG
jgi:hypothetical protein